MSFDITIIGSGIAAAAALLALKDFDGHIAVLSPERDATPRIGETLAPTSMGVLDELGIKDSFLQQGYREAHVRYSAWGGSGLTEQHAMARREGAGWYLDRNHFDAWLWCEASQVLHERFTESLRHFDRVDGQWHLETRSGKRLKSRFLLDMSGRAMLVGRRLSERIVGDQLMALYMFLDQVNSALKPTEATLIESVSLGWWYSGLLPSGKLVLACFCDADLFDKGWLKDADAWTSLLGQAPFTEQRLKASGFSCAGQIPRSTGANSCHLRDVGGDGWLAAGDAALAFDPLSSHGITTALWSGRKAALAAVEALYGETQAIDEYSKTCRRAWLGYTQQYRSIYGMERRFEDEPFWQRRHASEIG